MVEAAGGFELPRIGVASAGPPSAARTRPPKMPPRRSAAKYPPGEVVPGWLLETRAAEDAGATSERER